MESNKRHQLLRIDKPFFGKDGENVSVAEVIMAETIQGNHQTIVSYHEAELHFDFQDCKTGNSILHLAAYDNQKQSSRKIELIKIDEK